MPKRYGPSDLIPLLINKEYIFMPEGEKYWKVGRWVNDASEGLCFEIESYFGEMHYYSLSEIDWWLDPMDVE